MNTMSASQVCRTLRIMSLAEDALKSAGSYIVALEVAMVREMLTMIAISDVGVDEPKQSAPEDAYDAWSDKQW